MTSKDKTYPLMIDYIPDEFIKAAQKKLNESAEKTACLIRELKNMAKADKTTKDIDFQIDFLHQFLRVGKYNVDAAFKRLSKYVHMRMKINSFFMGVQDRISSTAAYRWASPLPWRSYDGCTVVIFKFGDWNIDNITYEQLNRLVQIIIHQTLRIPLTQINGFRLILDFEGTSWRQLKFWSPSNALQVAQLYQESTAARFIGIHCVNCSLIMKIAFSIILPLVSEKLRKRIVYHKHVDELSEYFPKYILPVEYGGDIKDFYMYSWMKEANDQMALSTVSGQRNIF